MKALKVFILVFVVVFMSIPASAKKGMTWGELKARIQTITKGDLSWSDSIWINMGNLGIELLSDQADCSIDTVTIYIVTGQCEYSLPVTFEKLWWVVNRAGYNVFERLPGEDRGIGGTGIDEDILKTFAYTAPKGKLGNVITFYPVPPVSDSALVCYFKEPDDITADIDTIDVFSYYHSALLTACLIYVNERLSGTMGKSEANRLEAKLTYQINNANIRMRSNPPDVEVLSRIIGRAGQ